MHFYSFIHDSKSLTKISPHHFYKYGSLTPIETNVDFTLPKHDDVLILNLDPFTLNNFKFRDIQLVQARKIAIICDTHHGYLPISRHIHLCLRLQVSDIILRFNQRHKSLFESFDFNVHCPLFSPDILLQFQNGKLQFQYPNEKRDSRLVSIGRLSAFHKYRNYITQSNCEDKNIGGHIVAKTTDSLDNMYKIMSQFRYALNVSLNMDFNRRLLEMLVAGCIPFSDQLEQNQLIGVFDIFKTGIIWYKNKDELINLIYNRESNYKFYLGKTISLQNKVLSLARNNYDQMVREKMIESLVSKKMNTHMHKHLYLQKLFNLFEYEYILDLSNQLKLDRVNSQVRDHIPSTSQLMSVYFERMLS